MKRANCIFWLLLVYFSSTASGFDVFKENGKVGLRDADGRVIIPAKYDALGWSKSPFKVIDNAVGFKEGGYWGLISLDNKIITKSQYEDLNPGEGSLLLARKKSNLSLRMVTGCINTSGKEILPFLYDGITLTNLRAIVYTYIGNQYRYGLVDLDNKALIPQQFQVIKPVGTLRFAVQNFDNKTALYNDSGKQMTGFSIDSISSYKKNYAIIYQNTSQGLLDAQGDVRIQPVYREIKIDDDGSVFHRDIDEWEFLNGQNQLISKKNADLIKPIDKNLMQVSVSGSVQLTDDALKPVSPTVFSWLDDFHGNVAVFSVGGKFGIARRDGTIVVPARYDKLKRDHDFFVAGLVLGTKESWTLLDKNGNALSSKPYEKIHPFTGRIFPVSEQKFLGSTRRQWQRNHRLCLRLDRSATGRSCCCKV
ncbi:MAG: WG repeat-containing protein [Chryseolinea sp.]